MDGNGVNQELTRWSPTRRYEVSCLRTVSDTMPWIRKSKNPFASHEDPVEHMMELLSKEGEDAGTPFDATERKILCSGASNKAPVPEELQRKSKTLIEQLLRREQTTETSKDPKSFNNSLEWAGESSYPNIVALTEEVVTSGTGVLRLHGRGWAKDKIQLVGCALAVVLLMFLLVVSFSVIFHGK
jgi:hypothetical protein